MQGYGGGLGGNSGGGLGTKPKGFAAKPRAVMCYICGREYGTKSIDIHIKTCTKKWEIAESHKPKNQRRPIPTAPESFEKVSGSGMDYNAIGAYNDAAYDKYNKEGLIACGCGRTFLPDSLEKHIKGCK